ncbi:hypothetical protein [Candidatus Clavichlamydia salmonicola]|uniref:hypothetical protein n=1 Tax=Candidatus Clavichlamydia salmonicola TaxID=469812 RepID=UPI001891957B|nr:hypothetical protein [Candidatus Clavichlamydia salmonicola]
MQKFIIRLLFAAGLIGSGLYVWDNASSIRAHFEESSLFFKNVSSKIPKFMQKIAIGNKEIRTLELRYSPQDIIKGSKELLVLSRQGRILDPELLFFPYLLMEVKYSKPGLFKDGGTKESMILWSLVDGEMVIDSVSWEKTKGFEDCLLARASKGDFKVLKTLAQFGGAATKESVYGSLREEGERFVSKWLKACHNKKLISMNGNKLRLHVMNPLIEVDPVTYFKNPIVKQSAGDAEFLSPKYSPSRIQKMIQVAFGADFLIRKKDKVFVPVYNISTVNPDGSIQVSYWNAVTGRKMIDRDNAW